MDDSVSVLNSGKASPTLALPQDIKRWHQIEGWGFLPLYLYKLVTGLLGGQENPMRTLYRLLLLVTFPGLNDHFPGDYEAKLRRALRKGDVDQRQS